VRCHGLHSIAVSLECLIAVWNFPYNTHKLSHYHCIILLN
jgi:hypothetical protein